MKILCVGLIDSVSVITKQCIHHLEETWVNNCDDFFKIVEAGELHFDLSVVGSEIPDLRVEEIAQTLRGLLQNSPLLFCDDRRERGYDRQTFIKNGFTEAFLLPADLRAFKESLQEIAVQFEKQPVYRPVKLLDIKEDETLGFDTYLFLPVNKKYVRLSGAGGVMDKKRLQKLKSHTVNSVHIPLQQMQSFYSYSAKQLQKLSSSQGGLSETERKERVETAVRELMSGIFSTKDGSGFDDGKHMLEDAGEIIKSFLSQSQESDIYKKVLSAIGDAAGSYSHLSSVSTFAALFSMGTGIGKPEDMAMAGLFHDLGLSLVPASIQEKDPSLWIDEERKVFMAHPEYSLNLIKSRKIIFPQSIQNLILQHHERLDGSGYPQGLSGHKLSRESQLLGIADEFDELTCIQIGKAQMSPQKALQSLGSKKLFDSAILNQLLELFLGSEGDMQTRVA